MEKILLVEDDEALSKGIIFALERESFDVIYAGTVAESEKYIAEKSFDLIILDVNLPDGNGFDLCKNIRQTINVPIIFLTACDEEVNVVLGLEIGGDDYITKPFRLREFISRIKAVLRRTGEAKDNSCILISRSIKFNTGEMKLYKNNQEIILTKIEYKLINTFMNNPLLVLSRGKLLEAIWDVDGEFVDDNALSVSIRRLREKIEDNPSKPEYIITVRGMGYKWNQGRGRI